MDMQGPEDMNIKTEVREYLRFFVPIMQYLKAQNGEVDGGSVAAALYDYMGIDDKERRETIGDGQKKVANQLGWALRILKTAGLVTTDDGVWRLTPEGHGVKVERHEDLVAVFDLCLEAVKKEHIDAPHNREIRQVLKYLVLHGF